MNVSSWHRDWLKLSCCFLFFKFHNGSKRNFMASRWAIISNLIWICSCIQRRCESTLLDVLDVYNRHFIAMYIWRLLFHCVDLHSVDATNVWSVHCMQIKCRVRKSTIIWYDTVCGMWDRCAVLLGGFSAAVDFKLASHDANKKYKMTRANYDNSMLPGTFEFTVYICNTGTLCWDASLRPAGFGR